MAEEGRGSRSKGETEGQKQSAKHLLPKRIVSIPQRLPLMSTDELDQIRWC